MGVTNAPLFIFLVLSIGYLGYLAEGMGFEPTIEVDPL